MGLCKLAIVVSLLLLCSPCLAKQSVADTPFLQDTAIISTYNGNQVANWAQLPIQGNVVQVVSLLEDNKYLVLTNESLYLFQNQSLITLQVGSVEILPDSRVKVIGVNTVILATPTSLFYCELSSDLVCKSLTLPSSLSFGPVRALDFAFNMYWIGSDKGLFSCDATTFAITTQSYIVDPITSVSHRLDDSLLAAGSAMRLYLFNGTHWRYEWVGYIIDGTITSLAFDSANTLWIVSINLLHSNGSFDRISGPTGLPYNNISYLDYQPSLNAMWVGSSKGAMRYVAGSWKYYFGPRWIWGNTVISIASDITSIVVVDGGVSNITFEFWTLAAKAEFYQSMIKAPNHFRSGLVGECPLAEFGISEGCVQSTSDNDGLWTSMYLASQSFRYAVTKTPEAKASAWASFEAMELLNNISGVQGLPARSFAPDSGTPLTGDWWLNSTAIPGMMWKGNTSSDELCGHFFVYPLFHDLVCESDDERARPLQLIYNISNYIVENDFYLIQDGVPTRWGVWNPSVINENWFWGDGRGLNSLQILSWLSTAYMYTNDEKFVNAFYYLVNEYGYGDNMINTKITIPNDLNYSDDELMFLAYYSFFYSGGTKLLREQFEVSFNRTWTISRPVKSSLWNTIYGAYFNDADFNLDNIIETLQNWPLDHIDWPATNSQRLDYILNLEVQIMEGKLDSLSSLPWDEKSFFVWNGDPFTLNSGSGRTEYAPTGWLLPYWMARYHGFISN